MRRKLFCWTASEASGGGAERSKFAVRIFVKKSSDFNQKVPPAWIESGKNRSFFIYAHFGKFKRALASGTAFKPPLMILKGSGGSIHSFPFIIFIFKLKVLRISLCFCKSSFSIASLNQKGT